MEVTYFVIFRMYNMKWQEAINDLMEQVTLEYLPLE